MTFSDRQVLPVIERLEGVDPREIKKFLTTRDSYLDSPTNDTTSSGRMVRSVDESGQTESLTQFSSKERPAAKDDVMTFKAASLDNYAEMNDVHVEVERLYHVSPDTA